MLAALAGIIRWVTMAETTWVVALAAVEPLHGTVGIGVPTALLTLASGQLYGRFGAHGFLVMAAFCGAALPVTRMLREPMTKSA